MYYDLPPKPDRRSLRALVKTMAKELNSFLEIYDKAKRTNDAGYYQLANEARSQVEIARVTAMEQKMGFPPTLQESIELAIGKLTASLEDHPAFPEALSNNLNSNALPNFLTRIQQRATSECNVPGQRPRRTSVMHRPPASETAVQRKSRRAAHSVAMAGIGAENRTVTAAPSAATSPPRSTTSRIDPEPNVGQEEELVERFARGNENLSRQNTPGPANAPPEFPNIPDALINEESLQLQRRYDEILAQKLAFESRTKQQKDYFQSECQRVMDQMHGLQTGEEDDDEGGDILDPIREVIDQDERRRHTNEWVRSVSSEHSPEVVKAVDPTRPVLPPKTQESFPPQRPITSFQEILDRAPPIRPLARTPDPSGLPTQPKSHSVLPPTQGVKQNAQGIIQSAPRVSNMHPLRQPSNPTPGPVPIQSEHTFKLPPTPVFQPPRHHRELERSLLQDHQVVRPKTHVSRPVIPNPQPQTMFDPNQLQGNNYSLFGNRNPFPSTSQAQSFPYDSQLPPDYKPTDFSPENFTPNQAPEMKESYASKAAPKIGDEVKASRPASLGNQDARTPTSEVPVFVDDGRMEDSTPTQVDLTPNDGNSASQKLLVLQADICAGKYLKNNRFEKEERFTGNEEKDLHDLETVIGRFEFVTTQPGVSSGQRKLEMRHYFGGEAAKIVQRYDNIPDPDEAVRLTLKHLRKEFGREDESAIKMVEKLLRGKEVDKNSWEEMTRIRLDLENYYQRAKETGRESNFNTAETINKIIQSKFGFLAYKWCTEKHRQGHNNKKPFEAFLEFLFEQNKIRKDLSSLLGSNKEKKKGDNYAIDAVDLEDENETSQRGANSNSRRGGRSGPSKSNENAVINATNDWTVVNTRRNGNFRGNNGTNNNNQAVNNNPPTNSNNPGVSNSNPTGAQNNADNNQPKIAATGGWGNNFRGNNPRPFNNYRNNYYPRGNNYNNNNNGYYNYNNPTRNNAGESNNDNNRRNNDAADRGNNADQVNDRLLSLANQGGETRTGGVDGNAAGNNNAVSPNQDEGEGLWRCLVCRSTKLHSLVNCATYINKTYDDRLQTTLTLGLCLNCLTRGHRAVNCPERPLCKICTKPHHTLLHRPRNDNGPTDGQNINA